MRWIAAMVCIFCTVAAAQSQRSFSVASSYGPVTPPGAWIPLNVMFSNPAERDASGYVLMAAADEQGGVRFQLPVRVPPNSRVRETGLGYFFPPANPPRGNKPRVLTAPAWHAADGARLERTEVLAPPANIKNTDIVGYVLLVDEAQTPATESDSPQNLADLLRAGCDLSLGAASVTYDRAPRRAVEYESCRVIALGGDVDALDGAQRQALLDAVRHGSLLLLTSRLEGDWAGGWLAEVLPAIPVGRREADAVPRPGGSLKLREAAQLVEASAGAGEVLLGDSAYVHVARRPLGLGAVVFTSFPIGALLEKDDAAAALWRRILQDTGRPDWRQTRLAGSYNDVLGGMLGRRTAAWSAAAAVVGVYTGLVVVLHLILRGVQRPRAFAFSAVAAGGLCLFLVALTLLRSRGQELASATLGILDVAEGGGTMRQIAALAGVPRELQLSAAQGASLRPVISRENEAPLLRTDPFSARAAAHTGRVGQIWELLAVHRAGASAVGRFDENGLSLRVRHDLPGVLRAPLLLFNQSAWRLEDLPAGESAAQAQSSNRNTPGDFAHAGLYAAQEQSLRGRVIERLRTPLENTRTTPPLMVAGWLDASAAPALWTVDGSAPAERRQTLVRLPLRIEPSPPGQTVRIDGAFVQMISGEGRGVPYDPGRGQWITSTMDGQWLLGFAPPVEAGSLRPTRARVRIDLDTPRQTVAIRRAQVSGGRAKENPVGAVLANWSGAIDQRELEFAVEDTDADTRGVLWLRLEVSGPAMASGLPPSWRIRSLEVSLTAQTQGNRDGH